MASNFVPVSEHGPENVEKEFEDILNYLEAEYIGPSSNDFKDYFKIRDDISDSNVISPVGDEFHTLDESCLNDLLGTPNNDTELSAEELNSNEDGIEEIQDILNEINDNDYHFNEPSLVQIVSEDLAAKPRKRGRPRKITQTLESKRRRGRPSKGPEAAIANLEQFQNINKPSHELEKMIIREQNRAASNRYRQKQKRELEVMETEIQEETVRNKMLKVEVENLENEVAKLKKAVEDNLLMPQIIVVQNPDTLSEIVKSTILSD